MAENDLGEKRPTPQELKKELWQYFALLPKNVKPDLVTPQDLPASPIIDSEKNEFQKSIADAVIVYLRTFEERKRRGSPERAKAMASKLRKHVLDLSPATDTAKEYGAEAYERDYIAGVPIDDHFSCESSWLLDLGHPESAAFFDESRVMEVERAGFNRLQNRYNRASEDGIIIERIVYDNETGREFNVVADDDSYRLQMERMANLLSAWPENFIGTHGVPITDSTSTYPAED